MSAPGRPVLRYHGGKFRLRNWIISHFPAHRGYTEAFGGAASVLMGKPRCYSEVLGDLDEEIGNVFRVLRNTSDAAELKRLLYLTPYARSEFEMAYEPTDDPTEQARRTIVKSFMGYGSNALLKSSPNCGMRTRASTWRPPTGFRNDSRRTGSTPAHDWTSYQSQIDLFTERLQGVVIETRSAHEVIPQHDAHDVLHYVDPPYLMSTRSDAGRDYRFEMSDEDHADLAALLQQVSGYVVLSGYESGLYNDLYPNWTRVERKHLADQGKTTKEVLWLSPRTSDALSEHRLFDFGLERVGAAL